MLTKDGAILGVHSKKFGPTSVQFKGEINDTRPCKRHQKRHLEFCTAQHLSRGSGVRIPPGAPLSIGPAGRLKTHVGKGGRNRRFAQNPYLR
jgi:hypothetical protein